MNQKSIGIIIIIIGILVALLIFNLKLKEDKYINNVISETGSCYLADGTCLHDDRSMTPYILGWSVSLALILFGAYIGFIDKTQETLAKHQLQVVNALKQTKLKEQSKNEFNAFLAGFDKDKQKILKAIKEQDGILQATLRYRTGLSKTALSLHLKELEEKHYITRSKHGKTKKVFLQQQY